MNTEETREFRPSRRIAGAMVVLTMSLLGVLGHSAASASGDSASGAKAAPTSTVDATASATGTPTPPDGLGTDAELNTLAESCFNGELVDCDHLFLQSPAGSPYEEYGDTCGGRQEAGTEAWCGLTGGEPPADPNSVEPLAPTGLGDDPALNDLANSCYVGDMQACDDLYTQSDQGSPYFVYADTCAGRQPEDTGNFCTAITNPTPGTGVTDTTAPGTTQPLVVVPSTSTVPVVTTPVTAVVPPVTAVVPPVTATVPPVTAVVPPVTAVVPPVTAVVPPVTADGSAIPPATQQPTGLGTDPQMDALAQSCFNGDMQACDDLYYTSPIDSAYESFAETCAGRAAPNGGSCVATFGGATDTTAVPGVVPPATQQPTGLGADPALDSMAQSCFNGDMQACDDLFFAAESASAYESYGDTCAGRQPPFSGLCTIAFGSPTGTTTPTVPTGPTTTLVPGVVPDPTLLPAGLGTDATLDALAQACYDGDLDSCDALWSQSDDGTPYRNYGDTCAGRQQPGSGIWCVDAFAAAEGTSTTLGVPLPPPTSIAPPVITTPVITNPVIITPSIGLPPATQQPTGLGADPALDALAHTCFNGDMAACDDLFKTSPVGSPYQDYGDTCAGRQPAGTLTYCQVAFPS